MFYYINYFNKRNELDLKSNAVNKLRLTVFRSSKHIYAQIGYKDILA